MTATSILSPQDGERCMMTVYSLQPRRDEPELMICSIVSSFSAFMYCLVIQQLMHSLFVQFQSVSILRVVGTRLCIKRTSG